MLTPLLGALVFRSRVDAATWAGAVLAAVGLGVLSLDGLSTGGGEAITFASAIVYSVHILLLARLSDTEHALGLSLVQLVVIAVLCTVAALTMVLQTWAQAQIEPSRAAVVMAAEPVWPPPSPCSSATNGSPFGWRWAGSRS